MQQVAEKYHPDTILQNKPCTMTREKLIVIGSSTGGTEALNKILSGLKAKNLPPIVIVQHIPKMFSSSLAVRLDNNSELSVFEVKERVKLESDCAYIASGDSHVVLSYKEGKYYAAPFDERRISRHRPSVDILFRSANNTSGKNTLAIILTGMGDDGMIGMKNLYDNGAYTIAQDEQSCVVFGMPKKAIEIGAVREILPLEKIANRIMDYAAGRINLLKPKEPDVNI
ncbi:chemotaxis protein CheB [Helicobacter saguini]|uniref:protein-glutamate methylesterase n=2 Tax=Helicobacter saguini TaxID=1548018 RepID=A0A347VTU2_9HELI|nr:chemotaxis protein CheB [Helicobacter saguini]MWV67748.1 chemotaxis protein CheB [Helicobacter saguini]MWV70784.1 chemotaxis protein CheB [Helicobacter saguini]MWV72688.1 chemotaxis protein CheB [Helicobacter saguini]TLD94608.1 chemotaxis protein CheB [Helicobacter saguini]